LKNAGDCDLSKSVKIGEQRDQLFRDAFFPTDFGVKKTRKMQENTRKNCLPEKRIQYTLKTAKFAKRGKLPFWILSLRRELRKSTLQRTTCALQRTANFDFHISESCKCSIKLQISVELRMSQKTPNVPENCKWHRKLLMFEKRP
jgi:hypothetical protein